MLRSQNESINSRISLPHLDLSMMLSNLEQSSRHRNSSQITESSVRAKAVPVSRNSKKKVTDLFLNGFFETQTKNVSQMIIRN